MGATFTSLLGGVDDLLDSQLERHCRVCRIPIEQALRYIIMSMANA
jgi:hypothetical protein